MSEIVQVKNALLSVFYKDGIVDMAKILHDSKVNLYSSGGTAKSISDAGLPVTDIAQYTGFPALFGHRVVTLHPKVHGSILYRRDNEQDVNEALLHGVVPFDLVVVNLYPVQETINNPASTIDDVVEKTDIGGPTLVRGAAKNHRHVGVVVSPADYLPVAQAIQAAGGLTLAERRTLAAKAFKTTAEYDTAIAKFYAELE